ncbi:Radical_SAM domain containing protein [uncultured Caudovirales phage]|uniref:Radical_SAM domain containing protein n=1 Tax=uncultured Caudovirales phage TaxID=2100421 RepID=A0A6J5LT76_9CAUD|nr:Radical_SAM domain containing protein [uncultured Caudovirales phage]
MTAWYCVAPFRQAYIDNTGVSACCQHPRTATNLASWSTHPNLQKLQQQFLAGQQPSQCRGCVNSEALFGQSLRTQSNKDYNNQIYTDTVINFVDYRASNICNFKCRSCDPTFSHGIAQEVSRNSELQKFYSVNQNKVEMVDTENFQWVIDNLDQIDRLMFTGGEPTVMPEVKLMLDQVIKKSGDRISVLITTNGSFESDFWYDLPGKIKNLHWTLSLDSIGPAAEIVRHGTQWAAVKHNAIWLAKNASSLMINSTVTNLSLFQLGPLLEFVQHLESISNGHNGCDHRLQVCNVPLHLNPRNLPPELLHSAQHYIQHCQSLNLLESQQNFLTGLAEELKKPMPDQQWQNFQKINSTLDQIRGEDYNSLLVPLFDSFEKF